MRTIVHYIISEEWYREDRIADGCCSDPYRCGGRPRPPSVTARLPTCHLRIRHTGPRFVRGVGWPAGATPQARPGFRVALYADKLQNPRWLYVLPNGDVLVAESANPGAASDTALTPQALGARWGARLRGMSANRITLFRDTTGDGSPDVRSVLLQGLNRPFGMTLLGRSLYVGNTDALMRFPYQPGQLQITGRGQKILDLPPGGQAQRGAGGDA
jgi:glucose/arabinose dehydrogenase